MKRILVVITLSVFVIEGCVNNSGASISFTTSDSDKKTNTVVAKPVPVTLTDLTAAKDVKTLLAQNWENAEDAQDAALSGGGGSFEMPYRGFSLFSDGTAVQNPRDDMHFGKWAVDNTGKLLTITYANGKTAQYTIDKISARNMTMASKEDKKNIEYRADGKVQKNIADDPFYGANNQWRIKPSKPETDEEIRERVRQALVFYGKYLDRNVALNVPSITFAGIPVILMWYKSGLAVIPKSRVDQRWVNCFYNKEQALKAQNMLENILDKKYKWDMTESNWIKREADGVRQFADSLVITPMSKLNAN
jgi:hypothetical protein